MKIQHQLTFFLGLVAAFLLAACGQPHQAFIVAFVALAAAMPWSAYNPCFFGINGTITMLDLAKANAGDAARAVIEEHAGAIPEFGLFPAEQLPVGEIKYDTLVRTGFPSAGFHAMGAGLVNSKSTTRLQTFECFPFGGRVQAAKHVADNWKRGGAAGYFAFEASGIGKAALFNLAKQIYYGRSGGDGQGFPGLRNFTAFGTTFTDPLTGKVYKLCLNANGTTANTAGSVYGVKFSTDPVNAPDGVQLEFGAGSVFDLAEPIIQDVTDPNDVTKMLRVYASVLEGFAGLMISNNHCVRRICNLTEDSGSGLTDSLLAVFMQQWPSGTKPDAIFMSARSRRQLQQSRTVTLFGQGTGRPNQATLAPLPTEYDGVPIIQTDAIADTDAIEVAALPDE